jgi:3D (Asp-Asp-Asp) domain-containing protein
VLGAVPVALAAGATGPQAKAKAEGLRAANGSLDAREAAATLELYALESQLAAAKSELTRIAARRGSVEREQAAARRQQVIATRALREAEKRLGALVRTLYEQSGHTDAFAIVLGSRSVEEALTALDSLRRAMGENDRIVEQTEKARVRLTALRTRLAAGRVELDQLASAATTRAAGLEAATAERRAYVSELQRRQGLNRSRIAALESRARTAQTRSVQLAAPAAAGTDEAPARATATATAESREPAFVARPGATLTVLATGYSIHGSTATGVPTARGVVAVDPAVIPLGTRLTIPGYGAAVAADTGGAVRGNVIDLWFPTRQLALAWGTRTVTITIG